MHQQLRDWYIGVQQYYQGGLISYEQFRDAFIELRRLYAELEVSEEMN